MNDVGYLRESDYKSNESEVVFRKTDPWGPFRFAGINFTQKNTWNFGGKFVNNNIGVRWRSLSIQRRVEMDVKETFNWNTIDSRRLRGGPDVKYNPNFETELALSTDRAKKTVFKLNYKGRHFIRQETQYNEIHPSMIFRLGNHFLITGQLDYAWNKDDLQYVNSIALTEQGVDKVAYIMGRMDQKTYGLTVNVQMNITPDLSVQYYGSPFTSVASYDQFKAAADTQSPRYVNRFSRFENHEIRYENERYYVDNESQGFSFKDPDFSFNEFRVNLVARWEYLPGSTLHFVGEHNRSNNDEMYHAGWGNNLDRLFKLPASNTFMMKVNYWFSL